MNENTEPTGDGASPEHSKRERIKSLGRETKAKTKRLLHKEKHALSPEEDAAEDEEDNPYSEMRDDPAFDPSQLVAQKSSIPSRIAGGLSTGLKIIVHPQDAAKKKAAAKVAIKDRPYLSRKADMEFLDAHDDLSRAKTSASRSNTSGDQDAVKNQHERVKKIEGLRQSRKVAWTTSRHFRRALVYPKREFPTPKKEDFYVVDNETGQRRFDWMAWLHACNQNAMKSFAVNRMGGCVDLTGTPAFDRETSSRLMERILIASSPWQSFFSSLRSLYLWEDPKRTKRWFAIWCFIWYMDYVITFVLAYTAIQVLRNRFQHKEIEEMRESYERTLDRGSAAYKFNEIIQEHGADNWIEPVVGTVGPKIQVELSDLADTLESLNNFNDWRDPKRTWSTLIWFCCAILIGIFTPTGYSMKIVTGCAIGMFFGSMYVSTNYPEYRHVVNPFNWIFWGIPNDADWSMTYLREKAQETRANLISKRVQEEYEHDVAHPCDQAYTGSLIVPTVTATTDPELDVVSSDSDEDEDDDDDAASFHTVDSTTRILGGLDILSFRCSMKGIQGRLIIFSDGLRFQSIHKEDWRRVWTELVEIKKIDTRAATLVSTEGLHLAFTDGLEIKLDHVRQRDKAFNCIIGFSGLRFQLVQPESPNTGKDGGSKFGFKH